MSTIDASWAEVPGATAAVARFIAGVELGTLPATTRVPLLDAARKAVADSLGVMLAGAVSDLRDPLLAYAGSAQGGSARVLGTALRLAPTQAALLNGAFGAALDYDDLMSPMHPSAIVTAALCGACAGGGAEDDAVDGRRFLEAYIIGIEVAQKISVALGPAHSKRGYHATSTLCGFAAFAALARLQRLTVEQIAIGLGLVATQSAGLLCQLGTMTKPLHSGLAARLAHDAVRMVRCGVTAAPNVLETRLGYFEAYGGDGADVTRLETALGQPWAVLTPGSILKRFASSVAGHRGILAVLELKAQGLTADNLVRLDCAVAPGALRPMMYPRPRTGLESKFSMPYALAAALLDTPLTIASFDTPATQRPAIAALLERIHAWEDPQQAIDDPVAANRSWGFRGHVRLTATTTDGRTLTARVDVPPGMPENPLSWDDLQAKFVDCAACVGIDGARAQGVFTRLQTLDGATLVDGLLAALQTEAA